MAIHSEDNEKEFRVNEAGELEVTTTPPPIVETYPVARLQEELLELDAELEQLTTSRSRDYADIDRSYQPSIDRVSARKAELETLVAKAAELGVTAD